MRDLAKFLYTHNPFYLISASCVLFGLRSLFSDGSAEDQVWQLAISLAAYTLLLAGTAIAVVRWGRVWEDARTLALLAILLCLALSVSFDPACNHRPGVARVVLVAGLLFSIMIVSLLERGLPIVLPAIYRIPLIMMLSLFFLFPIAVTHASWGLSSMAWRVLMFSPLCAAAILTLLPAIRQGRAAAENNGSPWPWPYYPWSIFFFMLIGMIGRCYLLTISFQLDRGMQSTFAIYYLTPILVAVLILMFEGATKARQSELRDLICLSLVVIVWLSSLRGFSPAAYTFHHEFTRQLGSPLWLSLILCTGVAVFFGWRGAASGNNIAVLLLSLCVGVDRSTISLGDFRADNPWPLLALAAVQVIRVVRLRSVGQYALAMLLLNGAAVVYCRGQWDIGTLVYLLNFNFLLFVVGAFGISSELAKWLRAVLGAFVLPIVLALDGVALLSGDHRATTVMMIAMTGSVALVTTLIWRMSTWTISCVAIASVIAATILGRFAYMSQILDGNRARLSILAGTICFLGGATVSATKAGYGKGTFQSLAKLFEQGRIELQRPNSTNLSLPPHLDGRATDETTAERS